MSTAVYQKFKLPCTAWKTLAMMWYCGNLNPVDKGYWIFKSVAKLMEICTWWFYVIATLLKIYNKPLHIKYLIFLLFWPWCLNIYAVSYSIGLCIHLAFF